MCGLVGQYNLEKKNIDLDGLIKMNNTIKHRGYDDSGQVCINTSSFLFNKNIIVSKSETYDLGLAHRRLSIIDLSSLGNQPMSNTKNNIWIVFNGEIYNHKEIRFDLEKLGYNFKSSTDTEVLIYAYQQYGISFLKKLEGVFSLVIWDALNKDLYMARDRMGVKPLYYFNDEKSFYFASEIKALINNPNIEPKLNHKVLSYYFSFLAVPAPFTLFKGIMKLEPATFLRINKDKIITKTKYWSPFQDHNKSNLDEKNYIQQVEKKLLKSVKSRMMSDVPMGVFLSGGVDSSLIVSMMSKFSKKPINTFTVGYKGLSKSNEFMFAKEISEKYATNHHELIIDVNNSEEIIKEMVYFQDEPIADPVCIPILLLSKKVKELGISVVQVGEGADEVFSGYTNFIYYYYINKISKFFKFIPKKVKYIIGHFLKMLISKTRLRKYNDLLDFIILNKEVYWSNSHTFFPSDMDRILLKKYENPYKFISNTSNEFKFSTDKNYLSKLAYHELNLRLPELLLMRVDKMTMASCVEGRVPFLDHSLVQLGLTIPDKIKIKNKEPKYIIKKIAEKYLPKHIIYRKKMGFGFPIKHFFGGKFKEFLKKSIYDSKLVNEGLINYNFVDKMFRMTEEGKVNYYAHLWALANLSMWYDLWFSGSSKKTKINNE